MDEVERPARNIPLVDYLELAPQPHLVANECTQCGARYVDRRNGCASCSGTTFRRVALQTAGVIVSYTLVHIAAPGLPVPYVAAIVDCGGTWVRANLVNVEPDPARIELGAKVRLVPFSLGTDAAGTTAIGFGFEPVVSRGSADAA